MYMYLFDLNLEIQRLVFLFLSGILYASKQPYF